MDYRPVYSLIPSVSMNYRWCDVLLRPATPPGVICKQSKDRLHADQNRAMASSARFATLSERELGSLLESKDSKNTKTVIKTSLKIFADYCMEKGVESVLAMEFTGDKSKELEQLNDTLRSFYAEVRQVIITFFSPLTRV